jgi:hypothetical protein
VSLHNLFFSLNNNNISASLSNIKEQLINTEMVVFVIVGKSEPLYEAELGSTGKDELAYLHQFILHSSLDLVDNVMWTNSAT